MSWEPSTVRASSAPAWVAVVAVPVTFAAGIVAAYWLDGFIAGERFGEQRSLTSDLVGLVVMSLGALIPASLAWRLGRRAETSGNRGGRWPRLLAAGLAGLAILWVLASLVANASQGLY